MEYELSVIAPCYNEMPHIPELVKRIQNVFQKKGIQGEIVLIDDGSTDQTAEIMNEISAQYHNIKTIFHGKNRGIAESWKSGLNASLGEYVCLIDSDFEYLPEDIWRLFQEIKLKNVDIMRGYRSSVGRIKNHRYYLSRVLNFLLNGLFGMNSKDNKSGFIICVREVLVDILRYKFRYYYFQTFITVAAHANGYTIGEIETLFEARKLGKSFIPRYPIKIILKVLLDLAKGYIEFNILNKKKENIVEDFLIKNPPSNYVETLPGWRKYYFNLYIALMPLHHWFISRDAALYYFELKKSQWLSLDQIKQLQEIKLRQLINHAYYHVGYYRELFERLKLRPTDIRTIEDLQKFPLIDKNEIRQNLYFSLMSDNHKKNEIRKIVTSGSTGEPFACYVDRHQLEIRWASTLRSIEWTGYRFGYKQARLWHQSLGLNWSEIIREIIDAWFNRRMFIPIFEMDDRNITKFMDKLKRHNPYFVDGYAEAFNFLAHYIRYKELNGLHPKVIISSAQVLREQSRRIIEDQFGCQVFDKYGSREFSGIAYECEAHSGHHVVAENFIVEILKDGRSARPGEIGEVVITDLNNYCMPFIRYRIGDLAVAIDNAIPCVCGRGLPRIGSIEGRVQAIIIGANGRYIPGTYFAHLFKDYDFMIRQYQVVQEELGKIKLKIVKAGRFNNDLFQKGALKALYQTLGEQTVIDVEFVEHIPLVHTGKHQGSISKINIDFQQISKKEVRDKV
jgi:phenylacetate-CoA ligase